MNYWRKWWGRWKMKRMEYGVINDASSFVVPAGVSSLHITAVGGGGGGHSYGAGGAGHSVRPGQVIPVNIGAGGSGGGGPLFNQPLPELDSLWQYRLLSLVLHDKRYKWLSPDTREEIDMYFNQENK